MDPDSAWTEQDSRQFIDDGRYFVPDREEQLATACHLVPACEDEAHVVELCCGEGLLAEALLDRHPTVRVLGLDGSATMRARAVERLSRHGERFRAATFDIQQCDPARFPQPLHAVVSMLAVHHLPGPAKRELFHAVAKALRPGGALVIADLIEPTSARGRELAARAWDDAVRERARALDGDEEAFARFRELSWNYYSDPSPDPIDQPSPLPDQLRWLSEAGFVGVDAFHLRAGHAIYGGWTAD